MAIEMGEPSRRYSLVLDESWTKPSEGNVALLDPRRLDPGLRHVVAAIERGDWDQLYRLTGIRQRSGSGRDGTADKCDDERKRAANVQQLPLLIEFRWHDEEIDARSLLAQFNLQVAPGYFSSGTLPRYVAAYIEVSTANPGELPSPDRGERPPSLRNQIALILNDAKFVARMELPAGATAFNEDALHDIELAPSTRQCHGTELDGSNVIVGIIDDGCAFAHPNFLRPPAAAGASPTTRVRYLWDQARTAFDHGWQATEFGGAELTDAVIDAALDKVAKPTYVDDHISVEDKAYAALDYAIVDLASHGTHVMDIAAGNGRSLLGTAGVAPAADIIFVQLPTAAIAGGGSALAAAIVHGIEYIFARAGKTRTVINISYGGYAGPHDGTSVVESAIDAALATENRAIVVAAGNGFEADCHAHRVLAHGKRLRRPLRWITKPEDPTENVLEVWWTGAPALALTLTAPTGVALGPVPQPVPAGVAGPPPPQSYSINSAAGTTGWIDYQTYPVSQTHMIRVTLNPTGADGPTTTPLERPGTWGVQLKNVATHGRITFDAWIERDTSGRPGGARRRQSHFHPADAAPRGTLATYASANLAISVGAYNTATEETCRYTACGPTRDGRSKPDVVAPAEEDAAGRGILSASSRSAHPTRMNGTSASAPMVTGMVALLFQRAAQTSLTLTAAQVLALVRDGAKDAPPRVPPLHANAHNAADATRPVKQGDANVWSDLIGDGAIYWPTTIGPICL